MKGKHLLTVQEAADFLGVSASTVRRWERNGTIKAYRHPANRYRYFKLEDLMPFRISEEPLASTDNFFNSAIADIEGNMRLREPQREAHRHVREHFADSEEHALVQMPVGCGKTGVIATLPFGIASKRVLVIAPNLTIRNGVAKALDVSNPNCFVTKTQVLKSVVNGPYCAVLDGKDANVSDCQASHYTVTNIQQLAGSANRWLPQFDNDFFDLILVDEGHHNVADSWKRVFDKFSSARVVSLTATPFRSDGRKPEGKIVYRYPFYRAMQNGFIKSLDSVSVRPDEIYFTYKDDDYRHTLDEVLDLREENWFRRGVALAPECNRHIAEASVQRWRLMRSQTGLQHQIIAAACSVDHARQTRALYQEMGLNAAEIHSKMAPDEQESVLAKLRQGEFDCIVQVQMLGEGFDLPTLSIAAVFRPFYSVSAYIQFVGRIMRVIHEGETGHPDNQGYVVSHVGLNNDARWNDFKELDIDDQQLINTWMTETTADNDQLNGKGESRRFDVGMNVHKELISSFLQDPFLDPEDDRVIDKLLTTSVPGTPFMVGDLVDKESLRDKLRREVASREVDPENVPVLPQRRRKALRARLLERTNSVANRILHQLSLQRVGWQLNRKAGVGGQNIAVITALLNRAVNKELGIRARERNKATPTKLKEVYDRLDEIGDRIQKELRGKLGR